MKKILILWATLMSVANAGAWSTAASLFDKEVEPTAKYQLDVSGYNPRLYEFDTYNGMSCVMIFSSDNKTSEPVIFCIKKTK